jgi:hypothetical protein
MERYTHTFIPMAGTDVRLREKNTNRRCSVLKKIKKKLDKLDRDWFGSKTSDDIRSMCPWCTEKNGGKPVTYTGSKCRRCGR